MDNFKNLNNVHGKMNNKDNIDNKAFEYTYSAKRQAEIEKIRNKYVPREEDKLELLKKLDRDVTKAGTIWALVVGMIGCLLFGIGMCCTMVWADSYFVLGIIVGIIGMAVMIVAYPIYVKITNSKKKKLTPQILALSEELLK